MSLLIFERGEVNERGEVLNDITAPHPEPG